MKIPPTVSVITFWLDKELNRAACAIALHFQHLAHLFSSGKGAKR